MSQSMAYITLVGRLTRDAELKYTNDGSPILHFDIATDSRAKKGGTWVDEASFWSIDLWGKRGESINQYMTKGKLVAVAGPVKIDRWEQDGVQHSKVKVNAADVQMLGGTPNGQSNERPSGQSTKQGQAAVSQPSSDDFSDEIPF